MYVSKDIERQILSLLVTNLVKLTCAVLDSSWKEISDLSDVFLDWNRDFGGNSLYSPSGVGYSVLCHVLYLKTTFPQCSV